MIPQTIIGAEPKTLSLSLTIILVMKTSLKKNYSKEATTITAILMHPVKQPAISHANPMALIEKIIDFLSSVPNNVSLKIYTSLTPSLLANS